MDLKEKITAYALQNALKYGGKANPGAVIGKVLKENPELKDNIKDVSRQVAEIIKKVNKMGAKEQETQFSEMPHNLTEKKQVQRSGLKDLPDAKAKVVMRFAPSPSGPLHIGHSYVASLNYEYAKKYKGTFIVRIEDTNPANIYPDSYKMIPEDAKWLCENKVDSIIIQSDRMDTYYLYALKLIEEGHMYVCTCEPEKFRKMMEERAPCPCRSIKTEEQVKRWKKMFDKYKPGEAVVRFKSDIKQDNPAMRDFPLLRITEEEHPRTGKKYRVWPLMNFAVAIDDMELGVTHALRGKDHADNAKRQELIHKALNHKTPVAISVGRINFTGFEVSCTKTRENINKGVYSGWEDIRIPFLRALRRRGYKPEALRKYALEVGVTRTDKMVSLEEFFKTINAFNKEIIDGKSNRYFFIWDPVKIKIKGSREQDIELDLHPDNKKGGRKFRAKEEFYITKDDFDRIKDGKLYRLMDCLNFVKKGKEFLFDSADYKQYKEKGQDIFHWLPCEDTIDVEVLMPDNELKKGYGEREIMKLKVDDVCQLQRFGFCRVDEKTDEKVVFWFAHK